MVRILRPALAAAILILVAALAVARPWSADAPRRAAAHCREAEHESERAPANRLYAGPRGAAPRWGARPGHPESFAARARSNRARASRWVAPGTPLKPGAYRAALAAR